MRKTLMPAVVDKSDDTHSKFLPAEEVTLKDVGCAVAYAITGGNAGHVFAHNATMVIEEIMNEDITCRIIGQMDNTIDRTFESANRVYDKEGLCPTIPTSAGGGHTPKILTEYKMGGRELKARVTENGIRIYQNNEKQTTASEFRTFQKMDAVCNSIMSAVPSYIMQDEPPKDRDGLTKPLVGVDKDDVVPESEEKRFYRQAIETFENNDCKEGDTINAFNQTVDKSGVCPTITTRSEGFKTAILPVVKGEIIQGGLQEHQHPRKDGISPSITAACGMGGGQTPIFTERCKTRYRIRKLTPRECGRLMGVKDSDIDKMAAVNSNSQLYKQFGNSIVVDVMCAMFRKLNIRGVERYV